MTDITTITTRESWQFPEFRQLAALRQAASIMAEPTNSLVGRDLRGKMGAIFTAVLMARDLGLVGSHDDPLRGLAVALTQIHMIDDRPAISAQLMRGLILRAGHTITIRRWDDDCCELTGTRIDGATLTVAWTIADAERAELTTVQDSGRVKANWRRYPRAMLLARSTTELARALFPDVILWSGYEPSELGGDVATDDLDAAGVSALGRPDGA